MFADPRGLGMQKEIAYTLKEISQTLKEIQKNGIKVVVTIKERDN